MKHLLLNPKNILFFALMSVFSCAEDDEKPRLRNKIDYVSVTPTTPYNSLFVDANGNSTVDLTEGNNRLEMFQALNYYCSSSIAAGTPINAAVLENMFSNANNPFTDVSTATISISGTELNQSNVQLRNIVASSLVPIDAEQVRAELESYFAGIAVASQSLSNTASPGVAGKLGNYLLDERGLEMAQIIQKTLIGAMQLDYIGNVLLDEGLNADNFQLLGDQNYTQLEHNWDEAYGLLTLNPIYLAGSTDATRNTLEFGAGSYIWEYNKQGYPQIYPAFLKGRAAIVNNDREQYQALATFIRIEMERTIASAAIGYLNKWKTGETEAARAHAIGEGLGFIYSLRFATLHEVDAAFSDAIIDALLDTANGFWDLNATKINTASDAIKAKFDL